MGTIEEGPQPDSVAMVAEKKRLPKLKKELGGGQEIEENEASKRTSEVLHVQPLQEGRAFLQGLPKAEEIMEVEC